MPPWEAPGRAAACRGSLGRVEMEMTRATYPINEHSAEEGAPGALASSPPGGIVAETSAGGSEAVAASQPAAQANRTTFEVALSPEESRVYETGAQLKADILGGLVARSARARTIRIDKDGKRAESAWSSVERVAVGESDLRALYRPVWHQPWSTPATEWLSASCSRASTPR